MEENTYSLPIGLCKQAVMKLDSAMIDISESMEQENISPENNINSRIFLTVSNSLLILGSPNSFSSNVVSHPICIDLIMLSTSILNTFSTAFLT